MTDSTPAPKPGLVFTFGRALVRPYLRLRYRPRVSGTHHMPNSGPVLIVSNHLSRLDTVLIPSFSPRKVQFLAKSSLFESRVGKWFFTRIGAVPVYRETGAAAQEALEAGERILATGQVFAIFPEGTRSPDGRLYRGRAGAAHVALSSGAQVVPVGLIGSDRRKHPKTGRRVRIEVRFGKVVPLADLGGLPAGRARREATERIMAAIADLSGQEEAGVYADGGRGA